MSLHHGFVSMGCTCGTSTVFGIFLNVSGPTSLCHQRVFQVSWALPLRLDRDFDGLAAAELRLPGLGHQAPVVSQRLVCSTPDLVRELHLLSFRSVLLTRASKMRLSIPRPLLL